MELCKEFESEKGIELTMKIKAECQSETDVQNALSFIAQSAHCFYCEVARELNSKP